MSLRVLVVTNMYPRPEAPSHGVFVGDQVASLRRLGVDVDVFFMNGRGNRLNYLLAYPRLWNTLRKKRYDVIHAHYVFSGLVARAQWQAPVVLTHHGPEVFMTWEKNVCHLATPWFDRVIVVSPEMRERLGYKDAIVIPCGVDMQRFSPISQKEARLQTGLPQEKKLVLWAGEHFRPEKRYEIVEEAMRRLSAEDPNVELVLLSGRPHADVPVYMNAADVLLLTSDAEGSPMVVKEAMSCNLPVVATDVGDVADDDRRHRRLLRHDPGPRRRRRQPQARPRLRPAHQRPPGDRPHGAGRDQPPHHRRLPGRHRREATRHRRPGHQP